MGIKQFTQEIHGMSELQDELKKMNEDREKRELAQRKTDRRNLIIGLTGVIVAIIALLKG